MITTTNKSNTTWGQDHYRHLNDDPPAGLHGHRDEGDDGVGDGEVEHQVVHVRPAVQVLPGIEVAWALKQFFDNYHCLFWGEIRICSTLQLLFKIPFYSYSACDPLS